MNGVHAMKRLFNLYLIFLKSDETRDKITLKNEIDLLHQEVNKDDSIAGEVKESLNDILNQYKIIYESDDLIERYEAEELVREKIEEIKKMINVEK